MSRRINLKLAFYWCFVVIMIMTEGVAAQEKGVSVGLMRERKELISDVRYEVYFNIPESKDERVTGNETVTFNMRRKDVVVLDFREGKESVLTVKANGKECAYLVHEEHIVISSDALRRGRNSVYVEFVPGNQSMNRRNDYVYTLFVPDRARTVFPCFDQPNLKARFKLTLDIPEEWKAVSNSNPSETHGSASLRAENGRKRVEFEESEPLPTYLFAFAAGRFSRTAYTKNGRTISAFFRESDPNKIAQVPGILEQVSFALDWMEEFTGMKYPFRKYDLVILPGFQFGGMEHTGATFYNDNRMLLPWSATAEDELRRMELIAHETAHMWFGDAVTMNWFNDVWTKEVFANYFAAEITNEWVRQKGDSVDTTFQTMNWLKTYVAAAVSQDRTEGRTAIQQELDNLSNAGLVYNNIIYNKAPVMMRKMVQLMSEQAFRKGIQKYLRKYKYGNATWDDLVEILDRETPADLRAFSEEWVKTANWQRREAKSWRDAVDVEYYGFTELNGEQIDSLAVAVETNCRASHWDINDAERMAGVMCLYENYLNKRIGAERFMEIMMGVVSGESAELLKCAAIDYMSEPMLVETEQAPSLHKRENWENRLWKLACDDSLKSVRVKALKLLTRRAVSDAVVDSLYDVWYKGENMLLDEKDYFTMAYELAIRKPQLADSILARQRSRIQNYDRLAEFCFVSRAIHPSQEFRDSLFESLKVAENRRIEPWTLSVLYYLNHPLREKESVKYIRPALEMLWEVQRTGDIFFPGNWCANLLAGHRSEEAYKEVLHFLMEHPTMSPMMKSKVLTAMYMLERGK